MEKDMKELKDTQTCYNCKSRFMPVLEARCWTCEYPDHYMWEPLEGKESE